MKAKLLVIVLVLSGSFVTVNQAYACGGGNLPPVAILTAEPNSTGRLLSVTLDGSTSYDSDGSIIKYEWDWTNDGIYDYNETPPGDGKATHVYSSQGTYTAKLRVTDDDSATDTDTCTVYVTGATFYVDPNGDDNNDGLSQEYPFATIQKGIDDANDFDTIVVFAGTYQENIDFSGKSIHVRSTDPNDPDVVAATIIDPNNTNVDVVVFDSGEDANSILDGMTIANGSTGVKCVNSSSPSISNCKISGNKWQGVYCSYSSPVISKCAISSNKYRGIFCSSSSPRINNCEINGNKSEAVYCSSSSPELTDCTINKNEGNYAVYVGTNSHPTLQNCVIAKNSKNGVYSGSVSQSTIINCTIVGNGSYGIYGPCAEIKNCILWDNDKGLYNCSTTYSCTRIWYPGLDNIHVDPMFVDDPNEDYHLRAFSLCIDAGDPNSDYSNEPDYPAGQINMGAYGNTQEAATRTDADGDGMADEWELQYWPGDDPNEHDPNDDPDGDNFTNWIEYLFGYDPNAYTDKPMDVRGYQWWPFEIDATKGEKLNIEYWLSKDANEVKISFADVRYGLVARQIVQTGTAGINYTYDVWDGINTSGLVVEPNFFSITITAKAQSDPNDTDTWVSADGYQIAPHMNNVVADTSTFDPYANIPVQIDFDLTDRGKPSLGVCELDGWTVIYSFMAADRLLAAGHHTLYWYGRDNNGEIYAGDFYVYRSAPAGSGEVKPGAMLVYYDYPVFEIKDLRCNAYRIIPVYNEVSTITYQLTRGADVTIDITDPDGSHFRTLLDDEFQTAGSQEVEWNGKDDSGRYVSTEGVYAVTITAEDPNHPDIESTQTGSITAYR